ncbi:hypothetical protein GF322_00860 [Candidatus Dependentiae bacterium]|nr:hypothetical protein [Candidatus Dependentiae bacterium]
MDMQKVNNKNFQKDIIKEKSYSEIVDYLAARRYMDYDKNVLSRMIKLNNIFNDISSQLDIALVGGTNGKSLTIHFASKVLQEEGVKIGSLYSSNFLNYNEQISIDGEAISNKEFTDSLNKVINVVELNDINATTFEILIIASLLYFKSKNVDFVFLEVGLGGKYDATNFCNPIISVVTRVAQDHSEILGNDLEQITDHMLEISRPNSWFISAEQSKIRLQRMKNYIEQERNAKWVMPIRKLASLPYIYEQLYGRAASLGERIAQIYIEDIKGKFSPFLKGNLLATQKGQRGRPTLELKRQAELNPIKTLKTFWNEQFNLLKGRFELLDKEKPAVLLDCADNLDAFTNLFLGIRLLHYQHPLRGLVLIIGLSKFVEAKEVLKLIRYLFKKVSGQVFFVPLENDNESQNVNDLFLLAKEMGIKSKFFSSLDKAFNCAQEIVHEREGLICITGSNDQVSNYWQNKGIKKLK